MSVAYIFNYRTPLMCTFNVLQAQVDLKVNPVGLLFKNLSAAAEFGLAENIGLEVTGGVGWNQLNLTGEDNFKGSIIRVGANGRYYFNPKNSIDGFYAGIYTRYAGGAYKFEEERFNSTRFSGGFIFGYKVVARNEKLLFDFGLGFGRAFVFKLTDPNDSTNTANLDDIPFLNWDIPFYISIGYRIAGGGRK
jgi:Protein of unknown function (DUF3575)